MAEFSNLLKVDKHYPAYGDWGTWSDAIEAALDLGAAPGTNPYYIWGNLGSSTENFTLPAGIHLRGMGMFHTMIDGYVDFHGGSSMKDMRVWARTTPNAAPYGVRFINDTPGRDGFLLNVNIVTQPTSATTVACIEATGSNTQNILYCLGGCYFYANHHYTGPNGDGSIRNVHYRLKSDYQTAIESFYTHNKSSSSTTGTATPTLILNECVAPATGFGYVHVVGDYEELYGGNGTTPDGVVLESVNTVHPGAWLDLSLLTPRSSDADFFPAVNTAYSGTFPLHYSREHKRLRMETARMRSGGQDYGIYPSLGLDHVPTEDDLAPIGSLALFA